MALFFPQVIDDIRKVSVQLLKAIGFMQQQNVIHADLKPDNILLANGKVLCTKKLFCGQNWMTRHLD